MMFKKLKGLLSLVICIAMLCTAMPITIFAAEGDVASVTLTETQSITRQSTMRGMRQLRWIPPQRTKQRLNFLPIARLKTR